MPPKNLKKREGGKVARVGTFSLDDVSIKRLNQLMIWMHDHNGSRIMRHLIDAEYYRQAELRGQEVQ